MFKVEYVGCSGYIMTDSGDGWIELYCKKWEWGSELISQHPVC